MSEEKSMEYQLETDAGKKEIDINHFILPLASIHLFNTETEMAGINL